MCLSFLSICELLTVILTTHLGSLYELNSTTTLHDFVRNEYVSNVSKLLNDIKLSKWEYENDIDDESKGRDYQKAYIQLHKFEKEVWNKYLANLKLDNITDKIFLRELSYLLRHNCILSTQEELTIIQLTTNMTETLLKAKICPYKNPNCNLGISGLKYYPDIENIYKTSLNYEELEYIWTAWRKENGAKIKRYYIARSKLLNKRARLKGYRNQIEEWRSLYESKTFARDFDDHWKSMKPLYREIHKFALRILKLRLPGYVHENDTLIPAHILGDLGGAYWHNIFDFLKPFPKSNSINLNELLIENNYTALKICEIVDDFIQSLGFNSIATSYNDSVGVVIEQPKNKNINCNPEVFDFNNGEELKLRLCAQVDQNYFNIIHEKLGIVLHQNLIRKQDILFRKGANPAFKQALGNMILLSSLTPNRLKNIGLLKYYTENAESNINFLMNVALMMVVKIPYIISQQQWTYDLFTGDVSDDKLNHRWWHYKEKNQKIKPSLVDYDKDFDPGSDYQIIHNRHFVVDFYSILLAFQFHRAMCITTGKYIKHQKPKPLFKCDVYGSKLVGEKIKNGLWFGASLHWKQVLKIVTDDNEIDSEAIYEYFEPLYAYLRKVNKDSNVPETKTQVVQPPPESSEYFFVGVIFAFVILFTFIFILIVYCKRKTVLF